MMSLFRIFKYSSILFFLGKYKSKLFRVIAVLLFAAITSLLYQDVANYLQQRHPDVVVYALIAKIAIVYGALAFVLWQFRPAVESTTEVTSVFQSTDKAESAAGAPPPGSRLDQLEDVDESESLRSQYDGVLDQKHHSKNE